MRELSFRKISLPAIDPGAHKFVVGGWIPDGGRQLFSALLLGEYVNEDLRYVGRVGPLQRASHGDGRCPRELFKDVILERDAKFCEPTLRIGVEYLDLTDDGYLRHAVFRALLR